MTTGKHRAPVQQSVCRCSLTEPLQCPPCMHAYIRQLRTQTSWETVSPDMQASAWWVVRDNVTCKAHGIYNVICMRARADCVPMHTYTGVEACPVLLRCFYFVPIEIG